MSSPALRSLIPAVSRAVLDHADELTTLDQAIGDGDHGLNMRRGLEAVAAQTEALAAETLPEALRKIGTILVMSIGGASGPLYGTLCLAFGKALPAHPGPGDVARALGEAIEAVKARGRSDLGHKTLLDVLGPVCAALASGGADAWRRLPEVAEDASRATIPLRAVSGRASYLGDRSIGHMDPGARSCALIIGAICRSLEASDER